MTRSFFLLAAASVLFAACDTTPTGPECQPVTLTQSATRGDTIVLNTGVRYIEVAQGTGAVLEFCDFALVRYTGLLTNGTQFDTGTFDYQLGYSRVIPGFEQGMAGMRVGGRRRMILPPELAYGNQPPAGSGIPAGATLVFDVELLAQADG